MIEKLEAGLPSPCADPESFARGAPFFLRFCFDEGKEGPNSS